MFEFPRKHLSSYRIGISFLLSQGLTIVKAIWLSVFWGEYKLLPDVSPCYKKKNLIGGFRYVLFHIYADIYFINMFISYMHIHIHVYCICKCIYVCAHMIPLEIEDLVGFSKNSDILKGFNLLMGNDTVFWLPLGAFTYEENILNV